MTSRVSAQKSFRYFPHTDTTGKAWQFVKRGTTTSAGAADGTTLIDTNGDSGGADTYNGLYWVRLMSGAYKGKRARVVDDNGTGTLTFETAGPTSAAGFPGQVASGVEYEIWKSPEPVVVVDSSSGATDMVDSVRNEEADDFWIGYWVLPLTGSRRGEKAQVTDYTKSSGTFVLGSGLSGALAAGDVVVLRKFVEVGSLALQLTENYVPRPSNRKNFSYGDGTIGPRGGSVGFTAQITGSGSLAAAASIANASVLAHLIEAGGLAETIGTSMSVTGGTSSAVTVTTATGERIKPGQLVGWNGNWRRVTSVTDGGGSDDTVNVSPAFPGTPQSGDVLYASRMYAKSVSGDVRAIGIEVVEDGVRTIMTGCQGAVTESDADVAQASWNLMVDDWVRQVCIDPFYDGDAYTTVAPVRPQDRVAFLDSTQVDIGGFTTSPNPTTAPRNVQGAKGFNGRAGFQLTQYACGATFRELLSSTGDLDQDLRWDVRTAKAFQVTHGGHGNMWGVTMPVARIIAVPNPADEGGVQAAPNVVEAQDAGVATSNLTTSKMPDYAWHLS